MKKILWSIGLVCVAGLSACVNPSYSVSRDAVEEMLAADKLAVTPFQPVWLSEGGADVWQLSPEVQTRVCAILLEGTTRYVPELAYQTDDEHNPLVNNRFYLYGSNGQCLAATVMNDRVVMHDVVLPEDRERELYSILKPYLEKVFKTLP